MDLFSQEDKIQLLPFDGEVNYYGKAMTTGEASTYFESLMREVNWKNDEVVIFGKHIITKRKVAWYADNNYSYTYSGATRQAQEWNKELLELKNLAEHFTGTTYNSCLLNLYHNGDEGMGWHSDDERSLGRNSSIASLSFGAERKFALKHKKSGATTSLLLESGSLLEMKGSTQAHWLHSLPKSRKITRPRINLTFRIMISD